MAIGSARQRARDRERWGDRVSRERALAPALTFLGVPLVKDTIRQFAERIAYVKETIYGQLFDVIAQPDDDATHLAYTSQALDLHTDMNYREKSPGFQMLHCLESKGPVDQGVSYFVDGFAAAEWLRHNHPSAFHILTSLPVEFAVHASRVSTLDRHEASFL